MSQNKKKIAILGAGPAGLAAAWGLTATNDLREQNDVTVYQVGWRAGGKCATGRRDPGEHIEQNCAHYLFGCYDNTFAVIREAYAELHTQNTPDLPDFDDVLLPRNLVALKQQFKGEWQTWLLEFPMNSAKPGATGGEFLSVAQYIGMSLEWMLEAAFGWRFLAKMNKLEYAQKKHGLPQVADTPLGFLGWIVHGLAAVVVRVVMALTRFLHIKRRWLNTLLALGVKGVRAFVWWLEKNKVADNLERQRKWSLIDYGTTLVIGLLDDEVFQPGGFERIDHYDFREWLKLHGANAYGYESAFVELWYQNSLAFKGGDVSQPSMSAAIALLGQMRAMLTYKGAVAFSLENEIGDTFIAPLYMALQARGVNFRFFHRLRDVVTNDTNDAVTGLVVEQQVRTNTGNPADYDPFIPVRDRPCWPDEPLTAQWNPDDLARYETMRAQDPQADLDLESFYTVWRGQDLQLRRGEDFDDVVFAMPHSLIKYYCASLYENNPAWRNLFDKNPVSESQSLRLWFRPDLAGLGWPYPQPILSGYSTPYCTWEDDGQLIALETWQPADMPASIACVFGPLEAPEFPPGPDDQSYLPGQSAHVSAQADEFMAQRASGLWPDCGTPENPHGINPELLVFSSKRANSGPTQSYTMTWPGALKTRLKADQSGVDGLYLAGDWVRNGLEAGSMEGATMAGLQASRAICGYPQTVLGEHDSFQ